MKRVLLLVASFAVALPVAAQITVAPGYSWSVFKSGLSSADGVVLHPNGNLYVCDERGTPFGGIWRVAPGGATDRVVTGMNRADGLALDWRTGDLICSEEIASGNTWRVDPDDGTRTIEVSGVDSHSTEGVAYDYATMTLYLVEDQNPGRVQAFDGTTLTPVASGLHRPEGVTVDIDGTLIVTETSTNRVLRIDPTTGLVTDVVPPGTVIQPDNVLYHPFTGDIFVGEDQFPGRIFRIAPDGTFSVFMSGLFSPQGMFFAPDGRMFVAEQNQNRVLLITGFKPSLTAPAVASVGNDVTLILDAGPADAGLRYRIFLSIRGSYPGTRLDSRYPGDRRRVPLESDPQRFARTFSGKRGFLDGNGVASAMLPIPDHARLIGRSFQAVGLVLSNGVRSISSVPTVRIQ